MRILGEADACSGTLLVAVGCLGNCFGFIASSITASPFLVLIAV